MSVSQTHLKIMSVIMLIVGAFIAAFALMHFFFAANPVGVMLFVLAGLVMLFDFLLGVMGFGAAVRPWEGARLLAVTLVALLVAAASVIAFIAVNALWWPLVVNALVTVAFAMVAKRSAVDGARD